MPSPSAPPEILEPRRGQLCVSDGVLDVAMTQVGLQGSGIMAPVGQRKATSVTYSPLTVAEQKSKSPKPKPKEASLQ
jgi:hypothetical protein